MFNSLKLKLQSFMHRRSMSICVESKPKRIDSKKNTSLNKISVCESDMNDVCPTPKRHHSIEISRNKFDHFETAVKDAGISNSLLTNNILSANNERPWLDIFSEAEQSGYSELLLPSSQDMKTTPRMKVESKSHVATIDKVYESQKLLQNLQQQSSGQIRSDEAECQTIDTLASNAFAPLIQNQSNMQEAQPSNQSIKRDKAFSIKQDRLQKYEKVKQLELKKKPNNSCMVCQETTCTNDSFSLACTHKIHRVCADITRWKPKMKCMLCERKNVSDIGYHRNKGIFKKGK